MAGEILQWAKTLTVQENLTSNPEHSGGAWRQEGSWG